MALLPCVRTLYMFKDMCSKERQIKLQSTVAGNLPKVSATRKASAVEGRCLSQISYHNEETCTINRSHNRLDNRLVFA